MQIEGAARRATEPAARWSWRSPCA